MWIPGLGRYAPQQGNRVGDAAPDFELPNQDGVPVRLSQVLAEGPVALVFYPRAGSMVCTRQMCSLRDGWTGLAAKVRLLGISNDEVPALARFKQQQRLPFDLLSDPRREVARLYGVAGWFVAARVSFLIGADGRIHHVIEHIQAGDHAAQLVAALEA